ncbi:MAG: T9SS C-terminal target domain-containing protein [Chitinophagaceae bacterium]|nr:MAG: T9SS C-terminal target domain-containing protein [Chitinophagaceae bacterium]
MKKLFLSVLFLSIGILTVKADRNAQQYSNASAINPQNLFSAGSSSTTICETLTNITATDSFIIYMTNDGYVAGQNEFGDVAKADFFQNSYPGNTLDSALLFISAASSSGPTATFSVNVWDNTGTNGQPGNVIMTEQIFYDDIVGFANSGSPFVVEFSNPQPINDDFYLGIEFSYAPNDTVVLLTTTDRGPGAPNSAWELWNTGDWVPYNDATDGWGLAVSHAVFAVMCEEVFDPCPGYTLDITSVNPDCGEENGEAAVVATGGIEPYSYQWNTGDTGSEVFNLGGGLFSVTVTDSLGCEETASVELIFPNAPTIDFTTVSPTCIGDSDGSAMVNISGGTAPFDILWQDGSTDNTISGLEAGLYSVTVTDANDCEVTGEADVREPDPITAVLTVVNATTNESEDGSVEASVSGGTDPYSYEWSNGGEASEITDLEYGEYTLTVTDANGCIATFTADVLFDEEVNSVFEVKTFNTVKTYPNPVNDYLRINHEQLIGLEQVVVTIFDGNGRIVYLEQQTNLNAEYIEINAAEFTEGIYFIRVISENDVLMQSRFIKQ